VLESYKQYLRHVRHFSPATLAAYGRDLDLYRRYLREAGLEGREPSASEARGFVGWLSARGLSSRSINRALSAVRGLFRFARVQAGKPGPDPFQQVRGLKVPAHLPSFLLEQEVAGLVDGPAGAGRGRDAEGASPLAVAEPAEPGTAAAGPSAASFWELRDRLILELLYATGCRVSELSSMNLTDLDLSARSIRVRGKGGRERVAFYGAPAAGVLKGYLQSRRALALARGREAGKALLINRRGQRITVRGIQGIVEKALRASGLAKPASPHTFRHSFATHLLARGRDIRKVQELLGHASLSSTQVYTHLDIERLAEEYRLAHPHARREN
jgi:site-specific recombinase XerD